MASITRRELRRRIGQTLRVKGRRALELYFTAASGTTTTTVSTAALGGYPAETTLFDGYRESVVEGTNSGSDRDLTNFVAGTGTLTHTAFGSAIDSTSQVEIWAHGLDATVVNRAIDIAISEVDNSALVHVQNLTLVTESDRVEYPLPTSGLDYLYKVEVMDVSPITGWAAKEATTGRPLWDTNANTRLAQQFVTSVRETVWGYALKLGATGSPNVTLTAELQTDSSGLPSGSVVTGSAVTLASTNVPALGRYMLFQLAVPISLAAGTYHLVLRSSQGALDASNYVSWFEDADSPAFPNGTLERYNGSAWSEVSGSCQVFQILEDPKGKWMEWPASDWHITRGTIDQLSFEHKAPMDVDIGTVPVYGEGHPVRLMGYRIAATPTADTDTIEANPNYVMNEAICYLLTGQIGGPSVDPDDLARQVSIWERKAELQRERRAVKTRLMPNTVRIRDSY